MREKKTVAICEREPITALRLRAVLSSCPSLELCAVVDSIPAAMELVREAPPSVLVLDQILGTQAVLDCLVWLRAASRPTAAIVLGDTLGEAEVLRFVRAGAKGIVCKTADLEVLSLCFHSVAAGAFWSQMEAFRVFQIAPTRLPGL